MIACCWLYTNRGTIAGVGQMLLINVIGLFERVLSVFVDYGVNHSLDGGRFGGGA